MLNERSIHWDACYNVRDLGGLATKSGVTTRMGALIRADNLSRLTDEGRATLMKSGIRTVIDVRDPKELTREVNPFQPGAVAADALLYQNVPLISEAEWEAIKDPAVMKQGYVVTLDLSKKNIAAVLRAIASAPDAGVVFHCHAGKERTGVVAMLLLELAGVPAEMNADDYCVSDRYLEPLYRQWADKEPDAEERARIIRGNSSHPDEVLQPLAHIAAVGGIDSYLASVGLGESEIANLRARLLGLRGINDDRVKAVSRLEA